MKEIKFIDLFAGIGGIRIAFEHAGAKCVASSEIDVNACVTYEMNFHEKPLGDITKIKASDLPDFDIIAGGFPCQPFSLAGKRLGFEDTRGTLFFEMARIISERYPMVAFLENVAGLENHDGGKTMGTILRTMDELGYTCKYKVMNAKDYGVPQNRNRWYCICFRNDLGIDFEFPQKCALQFKLSDIIKENIENAEEYAVSKTCATNIEKYLPMFKESPRYTEKELLIANEIRASRSIFRCDGISPCLTAKMGTGGNNVPVVVNYMRKLTEQECLRIMGFPEGFIIPHNSMHSYKQIGNSVCVPVIEKLAMVIMEKLREKHLCK